jgi:hypothetical protein
MPTRELEAYAKSIDPLAAERSLEAAQRVAVGTGSMKKEERERLVGSWTKALRRDTAVRPKTPAELAAYARSSGIGFRRTVISPTPSDS